MPISDSRSTELTFVNGFSTPISGYKIGELFTDKRKLYNEN